MTNIAKAFQIVNVATLNALNLTMPEAYDILDIKKHELNKWARKTYGVNAGQLVKLINAGKTTSPVYYPRLYQYLSTAGLNGDLILEHMMSSTGVSHLRIRNDIALMDTNGLCYALLESTCKNIVSSVLITFDRQIMKYPTAIVPADPELYTRTHVAAVEEMHSILVKYAGTKK